MQQHVTVIEEEIEQSSEEEEEDKENKEEDTEEEDVGSILDQQKSDTPLIQHSAVTPSPSPSPLRPAAAASQPKPRVVWRQMPVPSSESDAKVVSGAAKRLQAALARRQREIQKVTGKVSELESRLGVTNKD